MFYPGFAVIGLAVAASISLAHADEVPRFHPDDSRMIAVPSPALYPEGLDYDPRSGNFLLGSIRQGKVISVSGDGEARTLVEDERLRSVVGIRVDAERGRLLVNNSDYGVAERSLPEDRFATAAVAIYDLETGAPLQYVGLSALRTGERRFVNDLTVDADGNAYVTDSLAAAIYKITPAGTPSVFLTHERFRGDGFNLNGIRAHPDGFLLVAKKSDGSLFRVPLDTPSEFTEVALPEALVGTDGLILLGSDYLIAIMNRASGQTPNRIARLRSDDGWSSATIEEIFSTGDVYATTGTVKDGRIYVNYGQLHTLPASLEQPDTNPLLEAFQIQEIGIIPQE